MYIPFRDIGIPALASCIMTIMIFASVLMTSAQVRQSSSYRIEADSVNFGGGLSTSTNYSLESTAGEIATGESASASFSLKAGYQQMTNNFISISAAPSVTMTPSLGGITGGIANGTSSVVVTTDSAGGYRLSIRGSASPSMTSVAHSIADYTTQTSDPDFVFTASGTSAYFGYSPRGGDIVTRFRDDGASCNVGSSDTDLRCWDGLTTSDVAIAEGTDANTPLGATTSVHFRVGVGSLANQPEGIYVATTTLTAISL
jgi:hypothetical protein